MQPGDREKETKEDVWERDKYYLCFLFLTALRINALMWYKNAEHMDRIFPLEKIF